MIKEKINLTVLLSFVLGLVIFTSCDDDDSKPTPLSAITDVYVQKIYENDVEKTALGMFVTANQSLDSVTVKAPGANGKTYLLKVDSNDKRTFRLNPDTNDYATDTLVAGNYEFLIKSTVTDVDSLKQSDALQEPVLSKIAIASAEYSDSKLKATWGAVTNVSGYVAKLYDGDGVQIFNSSEIKSDKTEFAFGINDSGWITGQTKAEAGETYKVEILAILFESGVADKDKVYNIQYISMDSKDIVWGE